MYAIYLFVCILLFVGIINPRMIFWLNTNSDINIHICRFHSHKHFMYTYGLGSVKVYNAKKPEKCIPSHRHRVNQTKLRYAVYVSERRMHGWPKVPTAVCTTYGPLMQWAVSPPKLHNDLGPVSQPEEAAASVSLPKLAFSAYLAGRLPPHLPSRPSSSLPLAGAGAITRTSLKRTKVWHRSLESNHRQALGHAPKHTPLAVEEVDGPMLVCGGRMRPSRSTGRCLLV
jgi:hypothetical protein